MKTFLQIFMLGGILIFIFLTAKIMTDWEQHHKITEELITHSGIALLTLVIAIESAMKLMGL